MPRIFLLIISLFFFGKSALSQAAIRDCADFLRRMDQIHRDNFYTNYRDLADYTQFLGLYFDSALAALRPHEVWLDAGAGAAVAIREYLTAYPQGGKAVGVGVAYPAQNALGEAAAVSPNKKELGEQRFNYVEGYLEDLPPQAFQVFGPHFQLITDVFGPAMYSPLLDRVVRTYAELLAPDGLLMLVLDMHNLRLVDSSQVALPIQDWFLAMEGLEVVEDPVFFQERTTEIFLTVILRRTYALLRIPPLIPQWRHFKVGCPPGRCFRLER